MCERFFVFACERIFGFSIILSVEKLKRWLSSKEMVLMSDF